MNSITCWKVERLVQRMVKGIKPGMTLMRSAVALEDQAEGLLPSLAESFTAAAWIAAHNDARQALRLPLPH